MSMGHGWHGTRRVMVWKISVGHLYPGPILTTSTLTLTLKVAEDWPPGLAPNF